VGAGGLPACLRRVRTLPARSHGERVVRVATRLMTGERRTGRPRQSRSHRRGGRRPRRATGGLRSAAGRRMAGVELDIRLLVDHRERLVRMRTALNHDLLLHLHGPLARAEVARQRAAVEEVDEPSRAAPGRPAEARCGSSSGRGGVAIGPASASHEKRMRSGLPLGQSGTTQPNLPGPPSGVWSAMTRCRHPDTRRRGSSR
jgi:hypothetical protein